MASQSDQMVVDTTPGLPGTAGPMGASRSRGPRRRRAGTPYFQPKTYGAMVWDENTQRRQYKSFDPDPVERKRLQEFFERGFYYAHDNYTYVVKGWENEGARVGHYLDFDKLMVSDLKSIS